MAHLNSSQIAAVNGLLGRGMIRASLSKYRDQAIPVVMILMLGTLALTWFKDGLPISYIDYPGGLDRALAFSRGLYTWEAGFGDLGRANLQSMSYFIPYDLLLGLTNVLGIPLVAVERTLFYIWFTGAGLSMYYLVYVLMKGRKEQPLAGIVAAVFYMMSPFALIHIWPSLTLAIFFFSFFPLILGLFIAGLKDGKGFKFALLLSLVWVFTLNGSNSAPRYMVFAWLILLSYFVFHILTIDGSARWRAFRFLGLFGVIWLGLNAYWLINFALHLRSLVAGAEYTTISQSDIWTYKTASASVLDAMRLGGWWGLGEGYKGDPYYTWGSTYLSTPFVAISFLIPLLAFVGLLFKPRYKELTFFSLMALAAIFLIKGFNPPLGHLNELITSNTWLLRLIRNVYVNVGVFLALSYAFLIGWSVSFVYHKLGARCVITLKSRVYGVGRNLFLLSVVILLFGVYAYPFWTGGIIYSGGKVIPSARFEVPEYYEDAASWLDSQDGDFRVFSLPFSRAGYADYSWEHGYNGMDPTEWLIRRPVISVANSANPELPLQVATTLSQTDSESETSQVAKTLALLNVKYIVLHRDTNWEFIIGHPYWISTSLGQYESNLKGQRGLVLEKSFGKLDFYRNIYWHPSQIYAASNTVLVSGSIDKMFEVVSSDSFTPGEAVLFLSEQVSSSQSEFIQEHSAGSSSHAPDISFEKVNATKYQVKVTNATEPFFLVFSESYDSQWKAYVNSQGGDTNWMEAFFQGAISSEEHFTANGYANAWYIDPAELGTGEEFTITLYYQPQSLLYLGWMVSGLTLVGCVSFLVWGWRRGRRLKTRRDRV